MKTETKLQKINTGLMVPNREWASDQSKEKYQKFKTNMAKVLGLPDDWDKYLSFDTSNDYISLKDKSGYKAIVFRKFARNREALIDQDLLDRLNEFILLSKETEERRIKEHDKREFYSELSLPVRQKYTSDEWTLYVDNKGIELTLRSKEYMYYRDYGKCYILFSGEITAPIFDVSFPYRNATIASLSEYMQQWIDSNKPLADQIINKANEIKAELPAEFFTPVSVPCQRCTP